MDVSGISGSSLSAAQSAQSAADSQVERVVLTLKKQQDVAQDQAQGLINLVKNATPAAGEGVGRLINAYA
jgi:hypothetical protein